MLGQLEYPMFYLRWSTTLVSFRKEQNQDGSCPLLAFKTRHCQLIILFCQDGLNKMMAQKHVTWGYHGSESTSKVGFGNNSLSKPSKVGFHFNSFSPWQTTTVHSSSCFIATDLWPISLRWRTVRETLASLKTLLRKFHVQPRWTRTLVWLRMVNRHYQRQTYKEA